ncbi:DUF5994 family protein [Mycolicibacterium parafortuitum]|uniref:DUF5994 family protein n=1 Tax=Mycolicibacterium parafortuitum TaxID=39692 RepID=A0ACC6MEB1_MYCPF|nr:MULTISPECIES: DUF5994 family protein [Mycobacteriaceae]MDZ5085277.1 DUF5994 family protein [Mycolicibacterium parafortuitum]
MNGMARSRRAASPTRLALARLSTGSIDGAWWPHSALIAAELPDLVGALHRILGEVVDIRINWSATEGQLDLETIAAGTRMMKGDTVPRRPRLMFVAGRERRVKLLVVPSMTSQALGLMMLRTAAGLPADDADNRVSDTAHAVWQLAEVESAQWRCEITTPAASGKVGS